VKIAEVEVVPYALPFREPYVTARGGIDRREMVLLRLRSEEGMVGLGEAVPLSLRGGVGLAQVVSELEDLAQHDELAEATLRSSATRLSAPARCAALTALLDLRGRHAAGGRPAAPEGALAIECNATLVAGAPSAVAGDAEEWAAEGFSSFKLKLGAGDDVGQVRAVRDAVGPEARIRVDANQAWSVETAKRTLAELEALDIELAEQPVSTLEESAEVASSTAIPIAGDESIESRTDAERAAAMGACVLAGLKLSKVGGPEEAIEIAEVLPSFVSSALDGPVGIAAAAQVAQTLNATANAADGDGPRLAHGLATQRLFASTIASAECELRGNMLHAPPGAGLGVEIDEDALRLHRL
jgi:o-succinylbenzoate synthase